MSYYTSDSSYLLFIIFDFFLHFRHRGFHTYLEKFLFKFQEWLFLQIYYLSQKNLYKKLYLAYNDLIKIIIKRGVLTLININYKEFGSGKLIYFIHGNSLNLDSMIEFYEPFFKTTQSVKRIYLDIPGMGESYLQHYIKNSDDILKEIHSFISNHSNDKEFSLCGHSYGGYLCLGLAALFPDNISTLFLTCPVVKAKHSERILEKHKAVVQEKVTPIENKEYFKDYLDMNVQINDLSWHKYQHSILPGLKKGTDSFWAKISEEDYMLSFENFLFDRIKDIHCTVLLGKYDQIVGYKDQQELMTNRKNFEVKILPNSGHNLPIDEPDSLFLFFKNFIES